MQSCFAHERAMHHKKNPYQPDIVDTKKPGPNRILVGTGYGK